MSPRLMARTAGFLYLIVIAGGAFAEAFVRQRLVVVRDPAATAANLLANEQFYRWGFAADLVPLLCNVALAVLFYALFKVVNRNVAAIVAFFLLVGTSIQGAALLFHIAPLVILKNGPAWGGFDEQAWQALAYLTLRLQSNGYTISLIFFGCFGLSLGYLILSARFMPRLIGALMVVAGFCYTVNSMAAFLAPELSSFYLLLPVLAGEGSLALWMFFVGVNDAKWRAQAAKAGEAH